MAVDYFGASWKAVFARSLTFEQRQIERQSWWENLSISCALQLCFCGKHLNTTSLAPGQRLQTLPKVLWTQALTTLTSNFGVVGLVR